MLSIMFGHSLKLMLICRLVFYILTMIRCCCRPWYSFTATSPKDIIIMIDKSQSMQTTYLSTTEKKLTIAIKACKTAIDSLNPNDNVSTANPFYISRRTSAKIKLEFHWVDFLWTCCANPTNEVRALEDAVEISQF